jgi:uncharacterized protein YprB with RNaseH-like and TPR domain
MVVFFDIETYGPEPKGALNPVDGKIITIQVRRDGRNIVWKEWARDWSELRVIDAFLDYVKQHRGEPFIGDNLLRFDLPFIMTRWIILKRRPPSTSLYLLLHQRRMLDLYQILLDSYVSVKLWASRELGIYSGIMGKDIPRSYEKREYGKIVRYINDELRTMELVYNWMLQQPWYRELDKARREVAAERDRLHILPPTLPDRVLKRLKRPTHAMP